MNKPVQHHPYCKIYHCSQCLADCMALLAYLEARSGIDGVDHLGAYRTYLDRKGINSESDYGWPLPMVFDSENIDGYLERYKDDYDRTEYGLNIEI